MIRERAMFRRLDLAARRMQNDSAPKNAITLRIAGPMHRCFSITKWPATGTLPLAFKRSLRTPARYLLAQPHCRGRSSTTALLSHLSGAVLVSLYLLCISISLPAGDR